MLGVLAREISTRIIEDVSWVEDRSGVLKNGSACAVREALLAEGGRLRARFDLFGCASVVLPSPCAAWQWHVRKNQRLPEGQEDDHLHANELGQRLLGLKALMA